MMRVLADHIAGEIEMPRHPFAHGGQILAERERNDVGRLADEDRPVAYAGMPLDMLDHLGIVVGRQERLVLAARRHRNESDEIGEPDQPRPLQLGMLVPVVIDVPGLVGDDEVVAPLLDRVLEGHEVGDQHLVHAANRLKSVQFVLAGFQLDVTGFAGKAGAEGVNGFAAGFEQPRDGVLRQPVDLQIGNDLAQFPGDGDVPPRVAEPDRRRQV